MTIIERTEVETLRAEVAELRAQLEHFMAAKPPRAVESSERRLRRPRCRRLPHDLTARSSSATCGPRRSITLSAGAASRTVQHARDFPPRGQFLGHPVVELETAERLRTHRDGEEHSATRRARRRTHSLGNETLQVDDGRKRSHFAGRYGLTRGRDRCACPDVAACRPTPVGDGSTGDASCPCRSPRAGAGVFSSVGDLGAQGALRTP